jgi:thiol-disulfide isomerase/thioredoxin
MDTSFLAQKFAVAVPYDRYIQTGTPEQRQRWQQVYDLAQLSPSQTRLLASFIRDMKLLVVSGIWCGDCIQQCPFLARFAEANPARLEVRFVDRDQHRDLSQQLRINAGDRVPVALLLAEDFELCAIFGDRTLHRYRALAARQLGAACPLAIHSPEQGELAATVQDWLDEVERIQLMLLLSSRLRQKHND